MLELTTVRYRIQVSKFEMQIPVVKFDLSLVSCTLVAYIRICFSKFSTGGPGWLL